MTFNKEFKNITLFSMGKLVSVFGSLIYSFAMSLYILKQTGSGLSFASNLIVSILPVVIISPFAGVLADHVNRKVLVVLMDFLSGFLLVGLFVYINIYGLSILTIYITTFILSLFGVIFGISLESAKPNMVSDNKLMQINSISKIIDSSSSILAPIFGGILYALVDQGLFTFQIFIIINGISFIVSAISEIFINFKYNIKIKDIEAEEEKKLSFIRDIQDGFTYLKQNNRLMTIITFFIVMNFFSGLSYIVPLPYIINEVLKLNSTYFGIIQGAFPVGMIIGSLFVKKAIDNIPYETLLIKTMLIGSVIIVLLGLPVLLNQWIAYDWIYLIYYSLSMFGFGLVVAFIDIPILYLLQKLVEDEYRGRIMSLVMSLVKIITPLAILLSGVLVNIVAPWSLPVLGGMCAVVFGLYRYRKHITLKEI